MSAIRLDLPNAKKVLTDRAIGSALLLEHLAPGEGAKAVHPNPDASFGPSMAVPAILVRMQNPVNEDDINSSMGIEFWVYDEPSRQYWEIDRILDILHNLFDEFYVGATMQGLIDRLSFEFTSGEGEDDDLKKNYKFARYRGWLLR